MAKEFITGNDILSAFTQVNSSDGCVILPGGICFQWGSVVANSGSREVTVSFSKTLSAIYQAYVSVQHSVNEGGYIAYVRRFSTTNLTLYKYGSAANTLRWFVVGRV